MSSSSQRATRIYQGNDTSGDARVHYGDIYNFAPPAKRQRLEVPPRPILTVPFPRDPDYVQREQVVSNIHHKLSVPGARVALVGLGGVGKSQLAIEYAYRVREESPETWVLWLHASSAARFELSVRNTLEQLKVPGHDDSKANVFQLFRAWLRDEATRKWLIIFDNADDVRVLFESPPTTGQTESEGWTQLSRQGERFLDYLPVCTHGSLLITTRTELVALKMTERSNIVSVEAMAGENALTLLETKLEGQHKPADLVKLATELDFMPLAMTQAAAYINQRGRRASVAKYLEKLKQNKKSKLTLLERNEGDLRRDREAENSIISTWRISFEHILSLRESAAELLSLMSCFDRQAIPEELLRERGTEPVKHAASVAELDHVTDDETPRHDLSGICDSDISSDDVSAVSAAESEEFDDDLAMLRAYSFISFTTDSATFEMHRLVQVATQRWLESRGWLKRWQSQFINNLDSAFPSGAFETWSKCQWLFPHATLALEIQLTDRDALLRKANLLDKSAWFAVEQGIHSKSRQMAIQSVDTTKRVLGVEHPKTLRSMNTLGVIYQDCGQFAQAVELAEKVLEIRKRTLGLEHQDTLVSMSNLASAYQDQGHFSQAAKLEEQVLPISRKVLGPEHPDTLISMSNLALTYRYQGHYSQAAELQEQVLQIHRKVLGPEHPDTLISMNNLALAYQYQRHFSQAAKLQEQVLPISRKVLGPEHPDTLISMRNLALTYQYQGHRSQAAELQEQVLQICREVLWPEHPGTLLSMTNLAATYGRQEKYEQAAELEVPVLEIRTKGLGPEHPTTLFSMANLAYIRWNLGQRDLALGLMMRSAEISSKILGDSHPDTVSRHCWAAVMAAGFGNVEEYIAVKGKASLDEAMKKLALSWRETTPSETQ